MGRPSLLPLVIDGMALKLNGSQKDALAHVAGALVKIGVKRVAELPADLTVLAGVGPGVESFVRAFIDQAPPWYIETLLGIASATDAVQKLPPD